MPENRCKHCENALYIGDVYGMKAFMCATTGEIQDDCERYKEGIPRDGRIILDKHVDFDKIRSGVSALANRGDKDGKE